MVKTTAMLRQELADYKNPADKIRRMAQSGQIVPIIKGLYETDRTVPGHCLSGVIYGPSYLSFEFALSWHDLIPEAVHAFTSATCGKGRKKLYNTPFGVFTYRDVPTAVFPYGTSLHEENGYSFILASPEKAICDLIYTCSPCDNRKDLRKLLFDDLRIDENAFCNLNSDDLMELAELYHTVNHRLLISLVKEMKHHEQHHRTNAQSARIHDAFR